MEFVKKENLQFNLQRIWQVDGNKIEYNEIFDFINYANNCGFIVNYLQLELKGTTCYADNYNQVLINYDGYVYKCTARDFTKENACGKLLEEGYIKWNTDKLTKRLSVGIPKICEDCKLLPSCNGICSQKILEEGDNVKCILEEGLSKDDYIIYNFNRHALINNLK